MYRLFRWLLVAFLFHFSIISFSDNVISYVNSPEILTNFATFVLGCMYSKECIYFAGYLFLKFEI